jgi:hypothetical protein
MKITAHSKNGRRWSSLLILLFLLITSFVPVKASPAPASSIPAFSDGQWLGKFSLHADVDFTGFNWNGFYNGDLNFTSAAGELNGDWSLGGAGTYSGTTLNGKATYEANGPLDGPSDTPHIEVDKFDIHLSITVSGTAVNTTVSLGSGAGGMDIKLVSATCSQAVGDITTPVVANYEAVGGNPKITGSFTAIRVGDLSAADAPQYMQEVGDLLDKTEALKLKATQAGGLDFDELNALVTKAENLSKALKKNSLCGLGNNKSFITVITDTIDNLANFALANPQLFTTEELGRIAYAAVRVGALGSGAANSQQAADLQTKFAKEFDDRLTDAVNNNNCDEVTNITVAAAAIGDKGLIQQAKQAMTAICGGN